MSRPLSILTHATRLSRPTTPLISGRHRRTLANAAEVSSRRKPPPTEDQPPSFSAGRTHRPRLEEHLHRTLEPALAYLRYRHQPPSPPTPSSSPANDPEGQRRPLDRTNAYEANRPIPLRFAAAHGRKTDDSKGASQRLVPLPTPTNDAAQIPRLQEIVLSSFVKDAAGSKPALLGAIAMLHCLSGAVKTYQNDPAGVKLLRAARGNAKHRVRQGQAMGVSVSLRGPAMYDFIDTLVEFVLPRLRDFNGIPLPPYHPAHLSRPNPNDISGVIQAHLPPEAMQYFPQIEPAYDSFPKPYHLNLNFITNQRGPAATLDAVALLSGLRIPFARREKKVEVVKPKYPNRPSSQPAA